MKQGQEAKQKKDTNFENTITIKFNNDLLNHEISDTKDLKVDFIFSDDFKKIRENIRVSCILHIAHASAISIIEKERLTGTLHTYENIIENQKKFNELLKKTLNKNACIKASKHPFFD